MGDAAVILHWTGTLAPADSELTDHEIHARYGLLMQQAVSAFRQDPSYIVQMGETAAALRTKRERARMAS